MTIAETFTKNLRFYLDRSGLSQKDLAMQINVKPPVVCSYLKGNNFPQFDRLDSICATLHCTPAELFTDQSRQREMFSDLNFQMVDKMNKLNETGQTKAMSYLQDLCENPRYQNEKETIKTNLPWD